MWKRGQNYNKLHLVDGFWFIKRTPEKLFNNIIFQLIVFSIMIQVKSSKYEITFSITIKNFLSICVILVSQMSKEKYIFLA